MKLDIGCGFLKQHKKRANIGIDLQKGLCDVVADAENLPFQNKVFDEVLIFDVLEHLNRPLQCLKEAKRTSKDKAIFQIKIPCKPKMFSADLFLFKRLLLGFPFSIFKIMRYYQIREKHKHMIGYMHINEIKPKHIAKLLTITSIWKELKWSIRLIFFRKYIRKITRKFLREPKIGMSSWIIKGCKF